MRQELNTSIGLYSPTFLKMTLNVEEKILDVFKMSEIASAAFIHEYVHFLQDITTIYGQKNIMFVVDYIKSVNINQRQSQDRILKIPYIPEEKRDMGVYYNAALTKIYSGTVSFCEYQSIKNIEHCTYNQFVAYGNVEVDSVKLLLDGSLIQPPEYYFGSHAILESMAYEIEQSLYPGIIKDNNDFCYKAAREVIHFCYPDLNVSPLNIIALCDASLMYHNPAGIFYQTLLKMREDSFIPSSPYDIYTFIHSRVEVEYAQLTSVAHIFNNHTLTALDFIKDYFTSSIFVDNNEWIDYTFRKANEIRNNNWGFFVRLAAGGPLSINLVFKELFSKLGMPLVTNGLGEGFFASPVESKYVVRPDLLWAINQIYNLYTNSKKSQGLRCNMKAWCQKSCEDAGIDDYTDNRCFDNPWDRVKDKDNLCVFAQVWRTWGMEFETPRSVN